MKNNIKNYIFYKILQQIVGDEYKNKDKGFNTVNCL